MLFNSLRFLIFFPLVCILYWVLPHKFRNPFLLVASYYFYMCWEPLYGLLILFSTIVTWCASLLIDRTEPHKRKKAYLIGCLAVNLGILFVFKYANFTSESLNRLFDASHMRMTLPMLDLLLPVGISFYTFQAIGYTIDVYRQDIAPEKNLLTYALFVSFFPQLVAGPIERAKNLLPQFHNRHTFDGEAFVDGMKFMIWGYFMKLCVADRVGPYVDAVYNNFVQHNGTSLFFATFFFAFQIFCDFAGYSLIAIGAARCLGFGLMTNFKRPYLSQNIKIFWRRWHISLSTWFQDYLYIPLGGNRVGMSRHMFNLFVTFVISGIWHGANWTFLSWGALHGIYLIAAILKNRYLPRVRWGENPVGRAFNILTTFALVCVGWVFFRADSIGSAMSIIGKIISRPGLLFKGEGLPSLFLGIFCIIILMAKEIKDETNIRISLMRNKNVVVSTVSMGLLICFILLFGAFSGGAFIYFQF